MADSSSRNPSMFPKLSAAQIARVSVFGHRRKAAHGELVVEYGSSNAIEIPIRLQTNGYRCVFPELEGRLLLSRSKGESSSLSLLGAYREPEPVTGGIDDSLVSQHAAQTTVRDLLANLCVAMESESSRNTLVDGSS